MNANLKVTLHLPRISSASEAFSHELIVTMQMIALSVAHTAICAAALAR